MARQHNRGLPPGLSLGVVVDGHSMYSSMELSAIQVKNTIVWSMTSYVEHIWGERIEMMLAHDIVGGKEHHL